jgi:CRP-like cAMP-binding protein
MITIMSDELQTLFKGGMLKAHAGGETLFLSGESVRLMFFVTRGQVDLVRYSRSGARILLFGAGAGQILAEASAYSMNYHCDGTAAVDSQVLSIPVATFRERLDQNAELASLWAARLARGLQGARMNSAIKSMKTVEERLDAWLADGSALPPKGQWQTLAQSLGVSREAIYREMSRRRR